MSAFAALVLLGVASSCKDQNFDWDNVHSLTSVEKFTDTFIKEFGQPAEGHQWGFDLPWNEQNGSSATRAFTVYKPESENMAKITSYYGAVPNITKQEHFEVREWFSTHQVTWEHTTMSLGNIKNGDVLKDENGQLVFTYDGIDTKTPIVSGNNIQNFNFVGSYGFQSVIKGTFESKSGTTKTGYFTICNTNTGSPAYEIVEVSEFRNILGDYYTGTASTRGSGLNATAIGTLHASNSIRKHMDPEYYTPGAEVAVGTTIDFTHAWLQHVSYDPDYNGRSEDEAQRNNTDNSVWYDNHTIDADWWYQYRETFDERACSNAILSSESNMNYLHTFSTDGADHNLDYNSSGAWGFNRQDGTISFDGKTYNKNGQLICEANFNNLVYTNSLDGNKYHDKWIIVYLEGDGYAGWYLGFDFEGAFDGTGADKQVKANGVCDDWIIKLSAVDPTPKNRDCRIMCEDLGGMGNEVTVGTKVHISDIDYNDVVLDVTYCQAEGYTSAIKLTLQAAGGTLPLTVWYKNKCMFETHEMFQKGAYYEDSNHTQDVNYTLMYNTNDQNAPISNTASAESKDVYIYFGANDWQDRTLKDSNNKVVGFSFGNSQDDPIFDMSKLHLKVWRHLAEDYKNQTQGMSYSEADWINLSNMKGEAPLKICVPKTVDWLLERHAIHLAYPKFVDWVKNPTDYFWEGSINEEHLY